MTIVILDVFDRFLNPKLTSDELDHRCCERCDVVNGCTDASERE